MLTGPATKLHSPDLTDLVGQEIRAEDKSLSAHGPQSRGCTHVGHLWRE